MTPRRKSYRLEALEELFEFAMPKSYDGVLKVYQKIHDQIRKIGYPHPGNTPKKKLKELLTRRDMLEQWKTQVHGRLEGIRSNRFYDSSFRKQGGVVKTNKPNANIKKKPYADMTSQEKALMTSNLPKDISSLPMNMRLKRYLDTGKRGPKARALYNRKRQEEKLNKVSNRVDERGKRTPAKQKGLEHRKAHHENLLKQLGWK